MNQKFLNVSKIVSETKIPLPEKGDTILVGRWKNSPAIVKGFGKDKNNQPTVKTSKGNYSLFRFRIQKLMKENLNPIDNEHITRTWEKVKLVSVPNGVKGYVKKHVCKDPGKVCKRSIAVIDGNKVYLVNGKETKKKVDMDFTEGSNGSARSYVPNDEVWLDAHHDIDLLKPVLFHELIEKYLMSSKGFDYDTAHDIANQFEKRMIHNIEG